MDGAAGVAVGIWVIGTWYLATHGKGNVAARLAAWLLAPIVLWAFVALHDASTAGRVASFTAGGVGSFIGGIATFLGHAVP